MSVEIALLQEKIQYSVVEIMTTSATYSMYTYKKTYKELLTIVTLTLMFANCARNPYFSAIHSALDVALSDSLSK